ncbi:ADP-ribosylglycohydrolase family protein [Nonomuraea sp. NPDC049309]|uniref:ADP-ribosylglycohydrolase family protein n=1 Tax=Nonomuraea sp. NPDC049309 TaxID=3364350 RepID=UPI00371D8E61
MTPLEDRATGCVAGAAVGDALGGATEGWTAEQIVERYGGRVEGIVPPYNADWRNARPIAPYHKGDGHITDDTLMTHALIRVYEKAGRHLDAYAMAEYMVPELIGEKRWIPELEDEALPLQRIFLAEKWIVARLHYGHADPREAGVGNIVNCGAAMYVAPVGIVNAADPDAAYAEAIDLTGAHQSSYGREAAGVMAAAVAEAMRPGATADSVVATCLRLAKDGTRAAIEAVCETASGLGHWEGSFEALRAAIRPFDTVADTYRDQGLGARRPSRVHSIEELPLALAFLVIAKGDYRDTVLGGVNYGRDADSIASMGGAIAGALGGLSSVPAEWVEQVGTASRTDLVAPGRAIAEVARRLHAADVARRRVHEAAFAELDRA